MTKKFHNNLQEGKEAEIMYLENFTVMPVEGTRMPCTDSDNGRELIPVKNGARHEELLAKRHARISPGMPEGNVTALFYQTEIFPEKCACTDAEMDGAVVAFFGLQFKEENVLSVITRHVKGKNGYGILVYPLTGRVLRPGIWLENAEKTGEQFEDFLASTFGLSSEKNKTEKVSYAETDLIRDMDLPELDDYVPTDYQYDAAGFISQLDIDMPRSRFNKLMQDAVRYFTTGTEKALYIQTQTGDIPIYKYMGEVEAYFKRNCQDITEKDCRLLCDKIYSAAFGYYILDDLIADETISDIKILDYKTVRVKCKGVRMTSNVSFLNEADYFRFINSLAIRNGLDLRNEAVHKFSDTTTSDKVIMRLNLTTPEINSNNSPCLHIRKGLRKKPKLEDLIRMQCMPRDVAKYLKARVRDSSGLICGKGGSGKTVLFNGLIEEIGHDRSGVVMQEAEELHSETQPEFQFQRMSKRYDLKELSKNGLLTDVDYYFIGEIKGGEAMYFLNAANTGHLCWCTLHAPSAVSALDKMADYIMYDSKYNKEQAMNLLKEIKVLIFMDHFKVREIAEVTGWDNEKKQIQYRMIYKL